MKTMYMIVTKYSADCNVYYEMFSNRIFVLKIPKQISYINLHYAISLVIQMITLSIGYTFQINHQLLLLPLIGIGWIVAFILKKIMIRVPSIDFVSRDRALSKMALKNYLVSANQQLRKEIRRLIVLHVILLLLIIALLFNDSIGLLVLALMFSNFSSVLIVFTIPIKRNSTYKYINDHIDTIVDEYNV